MSKILDLIKNTMAKKPEVVEQPVSSGFNCDNCQDSGRECNECGKGKDVV